MEVISKQEAKKKGLNKFFTGEPCVNGHLDYRFVSRGEVCVTCKREKDAIYRKNNRRLLTKKSTKRYSEKKDEINQKDKLRYQENREDKLKYANEYRNANKDRINANGRVYRKREEVMKRRRERDAYLRKHCPKRRTMNKCRELIHRTLKVLKENKTDSTYNLLGYNANDLREHVEKYMIEGMTWRNFGEYWCLDHRYPVSRLVDMGITDPAIINHLDNLRPLLVSHNLSKATKTEKEYFDINIELYEIYPVMVNIEEFIDNVKY